MKKLVLISVVATAAMVTGYRAGVPVSRSVHAAVMSPPQSCTGSESPSTSTDNQCLAVSEDVNRAESVGSSPSTGCNEHTWNTYDAECNDNVMSMTASTTPYCPSNQVCGAYNYGIFENTTASNTTGYRLPVEISSARPVLSTRFQTLGVASGGSAFGFACFLLASTNSSGAEFTTPEGARRFVEYCFTQWTTGSGFPATYASWQTPAGSLLSTHFPGQTDGDESGVSSVTGVCANATSSATVDTVHVTYGSGTNVLVTDTNMSSLAYRDFKIDSRYVNRVLYGCGRGVSASGMRVVGYKTGFEGAGFSSGSAQHETLGISFQ
jgi:hypothetical protein